MTSLALVRPDLSLKDSYLRGLAEFQREGLPWLMDLDAAALAQDFQPYVDKLLQAAFLRTSILVPETILWAVSGDDYVGRISIRHELNDNLRLMGGHIGYDTVPSFRGQGFASQMLAQALPVARDLGLKEVLLTCDDTNVASIKVIEKNGGLLKETKLLATNKPAKRYYWIKLCN